MRLDLFLKNVCLVKSRSMASKGIDQGKILLNGSKVKASREVKAGDVLEIMSERTCRKVKVLDVPHRQVSKALSKDFYSIMEEKKLIDDLW